MKMIYRCVCMVLGAILGTGCSSDLNDPVEYGPGPMPEYGVPTGTINITGRVINDQGAPIPGVEVSFDYAVADTTDALGNWAIDRGGVYFPCDLENENECTVQAEDIDGPANGGPYPPAETGLNLEQTEPSSGSFDLGTWEQHGIDIVMRDAKKRQPRDPE